MTRLVDFVIAGVQKAGTTALFAVLRTHPGIFMPQVKEVHYFDRDGVDWATTDHAPYHAFFSSARPDQILGEATPAYVYWPDCIERIAAYNPAMKLIVVLRNPIDRAYSAWWMERSRGLEPFEFGEAIRSGRARLDAPGNRRPGYHKNFSYVERGFYASQLDRVLRHFERSQVLVLLNEDLVEAPNVTLARLGEFLGIEGIEPDLLATRHAPTSATSPPSPVSPQDTDYLRNIFQDDVRRLSRMIPDDLGRWGIL